MIDRVRKNIYLKLIICNMHDDLNKNIHIKNYKNSKNIICFYFLTRKYTRYI
jgi:hypothetical protein